MLVYRELTTVRIRSFDDVWCIF